ncbi:MAG: SGNH/GDSL hydrolase family protein [Acidobacteriota bacterium]
MPRRGGRWRRLGVNLLVSLGALLVMALVLEGVIRLTGLAYDPQFDRRGEGIIVDSSDPAIRKELPRNFDGLMLGARVRTNSFGMRGAETTLRKPPGTFRIAVLGDSWAFGWGVEQGEDFPSVLEDLLEDRHDAGGVRFEVLNFSVFAYNTLQELAVLRSRALAFEPDLVIVAFNLNDVEGHLPPRARHRDLASTIRHLEQEAVSGSHLVRLIDDRLRRLALRMNLERPDKVEHYEGLYRPDSAAWARVREALAEMRDLSRAAGAGIYLVNCPWISVLTPENPYLDINRKVVETAESLGIPAFDLFDTFEGHDAAELRISPLDGHPRAEGHRMAAVAILADLESRGLLPTGADVARAQ